MVRKGLKVRGTVKQSLRKYIGRFGDGSGTVRGRLSKTRQYVVFCLTVPLFLGVKTWCKSMCRMIPERGSVKEGSLDNDRGYVWGRRVSFIKKQYAIEFNIVYNRKKRDTMTQPTFVSYFFILSACGCTIEKNHSLWRLQWQVIH
jgi:hypothetical protein